MEFKFLLFTVFVLFAAFGSIEAKPSSNFTPRSPFWSSQGNSSPYRPWATVPPPPRYPAGNNNTPYPSWPNRTTIHRPICTDHWNSSSPCRPFGTVPPPINHGPGWNPRYPYENRNQSRYNQPSPSWPRFYPTGVPYSGNNRAGEILPGSGLGYADGSNSTRLYPSLNGVSEGPGRPFDSDYYGNRRFQSNQTYPSGRFSK